MPRFTFIILFIAASADIVSSLRTSLGTEQHALNVEAIVSDRIQTTRTRRSLLRTGKTDCSQDDLSLFSENGENEATKECTATFIAVSNSVRLAPRTDGVKCGLILEAAQTALDCITAECNNVDCENSASVQDLEEIVGTTCPLGIAKPRCEDGYFTLLQLGLIFEGAGAGLCLITLICICWIKGCYCFKKNNRDVVMHEK